MSIDLMIEYKDSSRKAYFHPFSSQQVLREIESRLTPESTRSGLP